jgi:hypothetical protein
MHDKFRGMPSEALQADGFEILLTSRPRNDAIKEIKYLSSFMRDNFPPTIEVRFVFGFFMPDRTEEHFKDFCEGLKFIPHPAMIRTTPLSKIPAVSGTADAQTRIIDFICSQRNIPIKISGNLNRDMLTKCQAARFGCTLEQAQQIQMEMSKKQTPVTPKSE